MKQTIPNLFRDGDFLSPSAVNDNCHVLRRDVEDAVARRYFRANGSFSWGALTNASDAHLMRCYFSPPAAIEITGLEVQVYGTSGESFTVTLNVAGSDVWTKTVTMSGATTLVQEIEGVSLSVAASATCYVAISGTSFNINSVSVGLITRYDRHTGNEPAAVSFTRLKSGADAAAGVLNTFFTDIDAAMDKDDANTDAVRFTFIRGPTGVSSAVTATTYTSELPATASEITKVEAYLVAAATETMRFEVFDEAAVSVSQLDIVGTGAGTTASNSEGSIADVQPADDPTDVNDDYDAVFSQVAGAPATIVSMYAVIWWV